MSPGDNLQTPLPLVPGQMLPGNNSRNLQQSYYYEDALNIERTIVSRKIAKFGENGKFADSANFRNFDPQIYDIMGW